MQAIILRMEVFRLTRFHCFLLEPMDWLSGLPDLPYPSKKDEILAKLGMSFESCTTLYPLIGIICFIVCLLVPCVVYCYYDNQNNEIPALM